MPSAWTLLFLISLLLLFRPIPAPAANQTDLLLNSSGEEFEALYGDEEFVSIATGSSKPVYKAPAVASVITAQEIEAMGATTLDEALETVPGLHVGLSTQGRLDSIYSIRGIHTKFNPQVLILMNGISFPSYTGGRPFQFNLPVKAIERIEIIRGPGSAIYGADAYAGVVNIITKDSSALNGTHVGGRYGSFSTSDAWVQHGASYGDWDIALSFEHKKTSGDRSRFINSDLQTVLDNTFGTDVSEAPGPLDTRYEIINTNLEIQYSDWKFRHWYWQQTDVGLGAGAALALDHSGKENTYQHLLDLSWESKQLLDNWNISFDLSYLNRRAESKLNLFPPGTLAPIGSDGNLNFTNPAGIISFPDGILGSPIGNEKQYGIDLSGIYSGFFSHQIRFGGGAKYHNAQVTSELKNFGPGVIDGTISPIDGTLTEVANTQFVFLPDSERSVLYLSLQDEYSFAPDWEITAGVRVDNYSDFGNTINPRLALVWATRHNLTTKLLYGRAFRAPTFNELYSINNPVALGNPDLEPETINTVELSFDYRITFDLQTNISFFYYYAKDLIEFVPDAGGNTATAQNARDQNGYGFEIESSWDLNTKTQIKGNYAFQNSEDASTGHRIAEAPRHQVHLGINWSFFPNWSLEPQFRWIGNRSRDEQDNRSKIDNYSIVDIVLHHQDLIENLDLTFAANNIFDSDAREPSPATIPDDYPLPGRNFWAGISYRF